MYAMGTLQANGLVVRCGFRRQDCFSICFCLGEENGFGDSFVQSFGVFKERMTSAVVVVVVGVVGVVVVGVVASICIIREVARDDVISVDETLAKYQTLFN